MGDDTLCYVGRCKCRNIVAAVVAEDSLISDYHKQVAKTVAGFIRAGLRIEQMSVQEVRIEFKKCSCPKSKPEKQETLAL